MLNQNIPQTLTESLSAIQSASDTDLYTSLRNYLKGMEAQRNTLAAECGYSLSITDAESIGALIGASQATLPDELKIH